MSMLRKQEAATNTRTRARARVSQLTGHLATGHTAYDTECGPRA